MNIAMVMLPERGALFPTYALAKALQERGHRVTYYGAVDFEDDVRRQGLEYVTLFREEYPKGDLDEDPLPESFLALLRYRKVRIARSGRHAIPESLVSGKLQGILRDQNIHLILLDPFLAFLAPAFISAGFAVVSLATQLMSTNFLHPPSCSSSIPWRSTFLESCKCRLLWSSHFAKFYLRYWLWWPLNFFYLRATPPPRSLRRALKQMERRSALRSIFSDHGWRYKLPELVLCPKSFDFPVTTEDRVYAGMTIDFQRNDPQFQWDKVSNAGRDIIYVSLGTHAALYRGTSQPFFEKLLATARRRVDLFFVVALGKGRDSKDFQDVPSNVLMTSICPQLEMLKRTSAMITNGGLGTIKECIWYRVPMIVLPCAFDQPGNAARVVFHGLGLRGNVRRISPDELSNLIDRCRRDNKIAHALQRMSEALQDKNELESALYWLESQSPIIQNDHPSRNHQ